MASNIKGITIEIGGDTTKLDKALTEVNKNSRNLQSELTQVNKLLKLDPSNTELLAQKQKILKEAITETGKKLDTLKDAEKQVQEQFAKGEISEEQYRALQREITGTEGKLKDLKSQVSSVGLDKLSQGFQNVGEKATMAGGKMLPVTAGVVALGAASIASFNEIDEGYDTIITKTGATGEAAEELQDSMNNVFSELPIEADTAGTAIGEVNKRFDATGENLEGLSKQFIEFAEINGSDLNNSIDMTDKIMTQWGVDASETGNVLGLLTSKSQETGVSVDDLMNSVQTNGAVFKEMGLDLGQSIGLLAEFEENGVNSEVAMAGLKKAVKNYTDEGKSTDEALKLTIESIKNASSETEALATAQEVFGTKGAAEMATAIREGRISIDDLSGSLSEYGTVVEDTFNATLDPPDQAKVALNNLKLAGADLGSTLMASLAPILSQIVEKVKEFSTWFKNLNESQKETIIKIAAVVAAIGPALIIFGKIATGISSVIGFVGKLKTVLTGIITVIKMVGAALMANPIALIIVAVVALIAGIVLLYNKCEWFRNIVNTIFASIKDAFFIAFDAIKIFFTETIPNVFNTVINFISNNWQALLLLIVNPFAGAFALLYNNCESFRVFIDTLLQNIGLFFQNLWNNIVAIYSGVGLWFNTKFTEAYNFIVAIFSGIGQWFGARWQDITNALSMVASWFYTMFQNAYSNVIMIFSSIGSWFGARWQDIVNAIGDVAGWFWIKFSTAYNNVTEIFLNIGTWFGNKFGEAWTAIQNVFSTTTLKKFFSGVWDTISGIFTGIGSKIGDAVGGAFKSVINGALKTIESTINKAIDFINTAIGVLNKVPGVSISTVGHVDLPKLAKGGTLKNGQAIFAEAGPELLTMVNGEAIVTPLSNSATKKAVNNLEGNGDSESSKSTFVQNNNYYSPKALSASESARQTRNATRRMALAIIRG